MNAEIPAFICYCRTEYLNSQGEGVGYFTGITIFSVASYSNESIKLQGITEDGALVNNLPISAICNDKKAPRLETCESAPINAPDEHIEINQYQFLSDISEVQIFKEDGPWQIGIYLFSIEWPKHKLSLHLFELKDGNYCLWPNEMIKWIKPTDNV